MRPLYFDYQATTPLDPRVAEAMRPYWEEKFGNPHSESHVLGWEAETAVEEARLQIAASIGASPKEIIFTSGATEANNLAIKGVAAFYGHRKKRIITLTTEHKCVLESVKTLSDTGYDSHILPVKPDGLIDLNRFSETLNEDTLLVSVMAVNNEIGVTQPLSEMGALCRQQGAFFHSDCAQALGRLPLDVEKNSIDLMSLSAHKVYGPMGIGALYIRRRPRVRLAPLFSGGGQERGLRSGTLPASLCVGFGVAAELAKAEYRNEAKTLPALRDHLLNRLLESGLSSTINGSMEQRVPGNINIRFAGVNGDVLLRELRGFCLSTGSACSSADIDPSYVLKSLGLEEKQAREGIRISMGRYTTKEEVDLLADSLITALKRLKKQSNP